MNSAVADPPSADGAHEISIVPYDVGPVDVIAGMGEVGSALFEVLGERRRIHPHDPLKKQFATPQNETDWLHICYPYSDTFISTTVEYVKSFEPKTVAIHATIPIGTTRKIEKDLDYAADVVFTPIRGRHPRLARYLRDFSKWYAVSIMGEMDNRVREYFAAAGMQVRRAPSFEFLEYAKLVETFTYGYNLVLWQELERQVAKLPGYKNDNLTALKSWLHEKKKVYDGDLGYVPIYDLTPGPIGGHCVKENAVLLRDFMTPELYAWFTKSNELRKEE